MPEAAAIALFERRLLDLGSLAAWRTEKVREIAEHHADLRQAALDDGLSHGDAVARADALLGDPILLAEETATAMRESSWWGRHPVLGFGVLPVLAIAPALFLAAALTTGLGLLLEFIGGPAYSFGMKEASVLASQPGAFDALFMAWNWSALLACSVFFCSMARRCVAGPKWLWIACGACSLNGLFLSETIGPDFAGVGYSFAPHYLRGLLPLLLPALILAREQTTRNRLPKIPKARLCGLSRRRARVPWFRTPTCWFVTLLILAVAAFAAVSTMREFRPHTREPKRIPPPANEPRILAMLDHPTHL